MNPRSSPASPARHTPLSLMKDRGSNAGFIVDLPDLFSLAMDQAIGIEKASPAAVVRLNSDAVDQYVNSLRLSPALGDLFNTAAQAFASYMELQMRLLTLMASYVSDTVECISDMQAQLTPEVLERSMDTAIGQRFAVPLSVVASISATDNAPRLIVKHHGLSSASTAACIKRTATPAP